MSEMQNRIDKYMEDWTTLLHSWRSWRKTFWIRNRLLDQLREDFDSFPGAIQHILWPMHPSSLQVQGIVRHRWGWKLFWFTFWAISIWITTTVIQFFATLIFHGMSLEEYMKTTNANPFAFTLVWCGGLALIGIAVGKIQKRIKKFLDDHTKEKWD